MPSHSAVHITWHCYQKSSNRKLSKIWNRFLRQCLHWVTVFSLLCSGVKDHRWSGICMDPLLMVWHACETRTNWPVSSSCGEIHFYRSSLSVENHAIGRLPLMPWSSWSIECYIQQRRSHSVPLWFSSVEMVIKGTFKCNLAKLSI